MKLNMNIIEKLKLNEEIITFQHLINYLEQLGENNLEFIDKQNIESSIIINKSRRLHLKSNNLFYRIESKSIPCVIIKVFDSDFNQKEYLQFSNLFNEAMITAFNLEREENMIRLSFEINVYDNNGEEKYIERKKLLLPIDEMQVLIKKYSVSENMISNHYSEQGTESALTIFKINNLGIDFYKLLDENKELFQDETPEKMSEIIYKKCNINT